VIASRLKIFIAVFLLTFSADVFAANPSQPFLPSDNVQDPNCTPADSNCYVSVDMIQNGGNSYGNTMTIGTNDAQALQFETDGLARMTVLANGNVGIGTSSPSEKLHIYAGIGNPNIMIESALSGMVSSGAIHFKNADGLIGGIGDVSSQRTHMSIWANGTNTVDFFTGGQNQSSGIPRLRIDGNGNIGIGTTTPNTLLTIRGSAANGINLDADASNATRSARLFFSNAGVGQSIVMYNDSGSLLFLNSGTPGAGSGNERARLNANGFSVTGSITTSGATAFMGIGTTTPVFAVHAVGASSPSLVSEDTTNGVRTRMFSMDSEGAIGTFTVHDLRIQAGNDTKMYVQTNGLVGIGTSTPFDRLQVFGDIRVGTTGANGCIKDYSGTGIMGTCSSDERLKTNVVDLSDGYLDKMVQLKTVTYNWNDTAKGINRVDTSVTNYGLLAQNVESVFPELVTTDSNGYKQVNYSRLPLYILKSVQELAKKVSSFAQLMKTDKVETKLLCVEDICVTKDQFKMMIQNSSVTPTPVQESSPEVIEEVPAIEETPAVVEEPVSEPTPVAETVPEI